uniref:Uncharacterized protein n=1 Tax=Cannabis sativa TaxID=3483 RepID=A0A803P5Z6_CANSA
MRLVLGLWFPIGITPFLLRISCKSLFGLLTLALRSFWVNLGKFREGEHQIVSNLLQLLHEKQPRPRPDSSSASGDSFPSSFDEWENEPEMPGAAEEIGEADGQEEALATGSLEGEGEGKRFLEPHRI